MADETNPGWQSGKSQNQCHQYMLENQVATDVMIKFPQSGSSGLEDKELAAHKYMLICSSPVFEAMLTGNFKEGGQTVAIPDVEPGVFMELLKFMYYGGAELSGDNVLHVMYAAKKYLIDGLVDKCKTFLETEMSANNVCSILSHCVLYDENELIEKCMEVIYIHTKDVLNSDDFLNCSNEGLYKVVLSDEVSVVSEVDIYRACVKWAKHQQQSHTGSIRDILGKSLYQIQFARMSAEELADVTEEFPEVLSLEEQCVLLRYTTRRDDARLETVKSMGFNITRTVAVEMHSNNRFTSVHGNIAAYCFWGTHINKIAFMVNKPVAFNGISVFGGFNIGASKHVTVKLFIGQHCVGDISKDIVYSGTTDPIDIKAEVPIKILKGELYRVEVMFENGSQTYYGNVGLSSVTTSGVTFAFFSVPGSETTTAQGQIPQIIFTK